MQHRGDAADDASTERVLKRKVKNARTNLYEWVKYRCHLGDGFFLCESVPGDVDIPPLQVLLANILSVHPKAASRFEITHATPNGHNSDEFMAPTSQHCALWVRTLKTAIVKSVQLDSSSSSSSAVPPRTELDAPPSQHPPLLRAFHKRHTTQTLPPALQVDIPCRNRTSPTSVNDKLPSETTQVATTHPDLLPEEKPALLSSKETTVPGMAHSSPAVPVATSVDCSDEGCPADTPSRRTPPLAVSHVTPSEHEAEEQLGILVRVEGVLKQLELENKLCVQRETQLRHELANLQDSMRLVEVERQELLTQLRDVTAEREEWKAVARRKQGEMTQLRDDLQLARDEIRLLTNEQLRLHHRNKDLAVHVQRLDTLVYGKF